MGSSVVRQMYLFYGDTDTAERARIQKGVSKLVVKLFGKFFCGSVRTKIRTFWINLDPSFQLYSTHA